MTDAELREELAAAVAELVAYTEQLAAKFKENT